MSLKDIPDRAADAYRAREQIEAAFVRQDRSGLEKGLALFGQANYLHGLETGRARESDGTDG